MSHWQIDRRTALKGLGTAMALPLLEAMLPTAGWGATTSSKMPVRMAFLYAPNGKHMPDWTPKQDGAEFTLPWILEPLQKVKGKLNVLSGLTHRKAFANGDGGGDHARALATFLTGTQARKTFGADIRAGISVDQVAAEALGRKTRFASLEIGCDAGQQSGSCDSGYSCAYSGNMSWRNESTPAAKEINPRLMFERLFTNGRPGESAESRARRERYHKSILDIVQADASQLRRQLGISDQRKLDEYLTAVRDLEVRLDRSENQKDGDNVANLSGKMAHPEGIPKSYEDHIRLMADMLVLAFQGDLSRVSTFVLANEGSNRSYPWLEVPDGHHNLSHHGGDVKKHEKIKKINRFHVTQLAYLLEKLDAIPEGDGTLLDHCMIVYGSGIGDGNRHNHDDLPILLAGGANGTIKTGQHLRYPNKTPLMNLYLSMLDRVGVHRDALGDSTGHLKGLDG